MSRKMNLRFSLFIIIYIIYEITCLKTMGVVYDTIHNVAFYLFDLSFFFWGVRIYLPFVWTRLSKDYLRFSAIIFFIFFYSVSFCSLGIGYQFIHYGAVKHGLSFESVLIASWRGSYITIAISAYSFLRYTIINMEEVEKQKVQILQAEKRTMEAEKQKLEAEKRAIIAENNYLRTVLNPHFLVNVFNMQYKKALMVDEGLANSIAHNADLMKYALLNNDEGGTVFLTEDISYMKTFLKLHQELHNHKLQIEFTSDVDTLNEKQQVPPLLFLNFIDNVFKYGELDNSNFPAKIYLGYHENILRFTTENVPNNLTDLESHNIGIDNAKERIQKYFGDRSSIEINKQQDLFKVEISITL